MLTVPLTGDLPSVPSAPFGLFGDFSDTISPSDCPCPFIIGLCPWTSQCGPFLLLAGRHGLSQFPIRCFRACTGSSTAQSRCLSRNIDWQRVAFRALGRRRHSGVTVLCSSIPDLLFLLPTLRLSHYWFLRMAWGHSGLLGLRMQGLSPFYTLSVRLAHPNLPLRLLIALGFVVSRQLALPHGLLSDLCSSNCKFASGFLRTSPHDDALALG
jgi:hypothetical protein